MPPTGRTRRLNAQPSLRAASTAAFGLALAGTAPQAHAQGADEAMQLPAIAVQGNQATTVTTGYQVTTPALSKLTEPLRDTPQSVTALPRQLLDDQGTVNTRDALRNVPGISLAAGEGGSQGDNLTLRGFSARNDFFLDGMRDFGSYTRDPFNLEQVQVLKGPSSILFGRGSTGGVVNQVSKQPGQAPITAGSVVFGTDGTKRLTTDVNRAITGLEGAAIRLNTMVYEGGVARRDNAENARFGVAPTITFGQGTSTRTTLSYLHQQEYDTPDYGLPWVAGLPAKVDKSNFYGFKDNDFFRTSVDVVTARVEHDINDTFSVRDQFRYGRYQRQARITEPQVLASVNPGLNFFTPYSRLQVTRNQITTRSTETFLQNQADVTARFRSGPLDHTVVTGFEVGKETSDPTRRAYTGVPTTSLVSPNSSQPFAGVDTVSSRVNTTADTLGVYALDTIKLGEHWQLIAGVRYDRFDADYRNAVPGAPVVRLDRVDDMFSYRAALVYKPVTDLSTYFSYGTSFNPSAESLALAANTASLAPEKTRSYEVGAKWDTLDQRLSLTGSIFRLEKSNARQTDPNDATLLVLAGNAQVDGFEIGATGHITDRLEVFAGYSYQNARLTAAPRPQDVGHALQNAPRDTLSFFSTYRLPWQDIKLGFGGNYVSRRNASTSASTTAGDIAGVIRSVPGYFTMQASASYPLSKNVELQANVYNISDRSYYDLPHPNHVIPGAGTSALFGINVKL